MKKQTIHIHQLQPSPFKGPSSSALCNFGEVSGLDTGGDINRIKTNIAATRIQANTMLMTAHDMEMLTEAVERLQAKERESRRWVGHAESVIRIQADALASIHPSHRKHVQLSK